MSGMKTRNRRDQPTADTSAVWWTLGVVAGIGVPLWGAAVVGRQWAGLTNTPGDPWELLFGIARGEVEWPRESWIVLGGLLTGLAVAVAVIARGRTKQHAGTARVDRSAAYLGSGREVSGVSERAVRATADRLHVDSETPGLPIGRTVATGQWLYGSWEDMWILIAGPRTGKSTAFAIPALLAAPGAALVTSNKRDLVDATREVRAAKGPVWVFDPQQIANEPSGQWWWNPLSYVTDEVKATILADHFSASNRSADSKTDAFFEPAGRDLLAGLLLAAALDERPITDVYRWLTRPKDDAAVDILMRHDYPLTADQVAGVIESPEKQRGGVYGTARQMASCLTNKEVLRWVTSDSSSLPHFDPNEFVAQGGTLYSLSKEGRGTAGALVTALTVAVVEAGEELAKTQKGGRLRAPLVGVLDEAANVCRWRDLPDLYSHYGSRGIILMTILQSWAQGVEVWGQHGMDKLWGAANIAVYGGGVKEERFLELLAKLIGQYDKTTRSVSTKGTGTFFESGASTSRQLSRERILDVDELQSLDRGRAIVLSSGNRATLVKTVPWMDGPHADLVRASLRTHDPSEAKPTNPWLVAPNPTQETR